MKRKGLLYSHLISIHAPAKGATKPVPKDTTNRLYFNPRSREGSDYPVPEYSECRKIISIHAPAKGATKGNFTFKENELFQSTLPRRERP